MTRAVMASGSRPVYDRLRYAKTCWCKTSISTQSLRLASVVARKRTTLQRSRPTSDRFIGGFKLDPIALRRVQFGTRLPRDSKRVLVAEGLRFVARQAKTCVCLS